jgi:hypothetical protein
MAKSTSPTYRGPAAEPKGLHEVTVNNGRGYLSVHRVVADSADHARKIVQDTLDAAQPAQPHIVDVATPADLRERERQAQAALAQQRAAAQREAHPRNR